MKTTARIISYVAAALLCAALAFSCQKPYKFDHTIAVNQDMVELPVQSGTTPVIVYSSGDWTARLSENVEWATLEKTTGTGIGNVVFNWADNGGRARRVDIIVESEGETQVVKMIQIAGNTEPFMYLSFNASSISKIQDHAVIPVTTNLTDTELSHSFVEIADADWISNVKVSKAGFEFDVEENISSAAREATIHFENEDAMGDKIAYDFKISQSTTAPSLALTSTVFSTKRPFFGNMVEASVKTNIGAFCYGKEFIDFSNITYIGGQEDWISSIKVDPVTSALNVFLTTNEEAERSAKVQLKYMDSMDREYNLCTFTVTQEKASTLITIDELIDNYADKGVISSEAYVQGIVIGDKNSKNMELNPNYGRTGIDYNVSDCTSYMQNEDGTRGIRLSMTTKQANILPRYSKGYICIKGAELVKETDPDRYTLKGLTTENVLGFEIGDASNVKPKRKTIGELTDDDVYTYVTLTGLEFAQKQGSFTNAHEGYLVKDATVIPQGAAEIGGDGKALAYLDCLTTPPMRDANGDHIYGLINALTPWRRTGSGVPQASVDVSGIIVHTNLIRAAKDGDIGRYSIRIIEKADIKNAGARFSKTLVDWNLTMDRCATPEKAVKAEFGEGVVSCGLPGATLSNKVDYNNLIGNGVSPNNKGNLANASISWVSAKWWDDENDRAPYFQFEFSTEGVSGKNLVFNWTACQGDANDTGFNAPANWHFEYSTDGVNFTRMQKEYAIRPVVWWTTCALYCSQGNLEYTTPLPSSLFGQKKVYLRLVASSKVAATFDEPEAGSVDDQSRTISIRFGELTLEYN